jgi:hypothetical protein
MRGGFGGCLGGAGAGRGRGGGGAGGLAPRSAWTGLRGLAIRGHGVGCCLGGGAAA